MLRLVLCAIALILFVPLASAVDTLASFEEPHAGVDKVFPFTLVQEESGKPHALIFRNPVRTPFDLILYHANGTEAFNKSGTRGIQTLPPLEAGEYRFFIRRDGAFQVTSRAFERDNLTNASTTVSGTADAYVLAPRKHYDIGFTGDVDVEWFDMTTEPESLDPPGNRTARLGGAIVMTVRGAEGTPYAITLNPTDPPAEETPGLPVVAVLGVLGLLGVLRPKRSK